MMKSTSSLLSLGLAVLCALGLQAQSPGGTVPVVAAPRAPHVAAISVDTITVVTGSTQVFTVDTPEDQGIVSTAPTVDNLVAQLRLSNGAALAGEVTKKDGALRKEGSVEAGDLLKLTPTTGGAPLSFRIETKPLAVGGELRLEQPSVTVNTARDVVLAFTAGQRSPDATVRITVPAGVDVTLDNTLVNVIGRGAVSLRELPKQSIGRAGSAYSYSKVGTATIEKGASGGSVIVLQHLDLRPSNGADVVLTLRGVKIARPGSYTFKATYTTSQPQPLTSLGAGAEIAVLEAVATVSDFARVLDRNLRYEDRPGLYTGAVFSWTGEARGDGVELLHSQDDGATWQPMRAVIDGQKATVSGLAPDRLHAFRLSVGKGPDKGLSNIAHFYSGRLDVKSRGAKGDGKADDTDAINAAIDWLAGLGGGTLRFTDGTYQVRTVHLRSNVYLWVDRGATILAIKGTDAPESAWFSDRKYRHGLSPTDAGPYAEPDNWLTKQDVGHHYFRNTMFFGERLDNVKILGTGRISGNGVLATSDNVMRNQPGQRGDKMFTLKLCTNLEIGGVYRSEDLWYDPEKDEPYYIEKDGSKNFDVSNMLQIDQGGHFVLLATGTDNIHVHNTYFAKHAPGSARDIYDFMQCNNVTVLNVYSKVSSDDIVKLGSDCSLGFTRPVKHYRVRNVIGDTNCNLFQIGSETSDDIMDVHVDNIYVTGANKAGFSISTNDGGHVKDVYLNSGKTGTLHSRSKMLRTRSPFFISISNRGRVLGATVARFKFDENGKPHDELLNTNINIGIVENIFLNHVDVSEIYGGSSFRGPRWKPYDGTQNKAAPIVAGYKLPDPAVVEGGLTFKLPNGEHTGFIRNIVFNDVHFVAKGGNPRTDTTRLAPELGVGQYNVNNLGVLPAYGLWARHVKGITLNNCSFNYEKRDSTYALYLENVHGAKLTGLKMVRAKDSGPFIRLKNATDVSIESATAFDDVWEQNPGQLPAARHAAGDAELDLPGR